MLARFKLGKRTRSTLVMSNQQHLARPAMSFISKAVKPIVTSSVRFASVQASVEPVAAAVKSKHTALFSFFFFSRVVSAVERRRMGACSYADEIEDTLLYTRLRGIACRCSNDTSA